MKITIIPADGVVGIDGEFRNVDLSGIDDTVHAVQYDTGTNTGYVEFIGASKPNMGIGKAKFDKLFYPYIQKWKAEGAVPERTLEQVKLDQRQQINSRRDTLEQSGFPYLGKNIDSNPVSVQRITVSVQAAQAAIAAGQPFSVNWTCQNNEVLTLDAAQMLGMPAALAIYANTIHQHARDKKALIDAATTVAEVEAVTW